jgi:hypothetical protein
MLSKLIAWSPRACLAITVSLVFALWGAAVANAGEIADCAHDRFIEAMASSKTNTLAGMTEAVAIAIKVCAGEQPPNADLDEFDAGVDRAIRELRQALQVLKGQKL